jgi:hypothetical protein
MLLTYLIFLTAPSFGAILGLYTSDFSLGHKLAVSLRLSQDTTHLHHFLKAAQQ